ncbi:MAG: hypothetical protein HY592_00305 [Candidatus Omnitrophica bacterium]|nr:hypothetical protein [Candidatus Omnitrophota bacterium]
MKSPAKGRWKIGPNHEIRYHSEGKEEEFTLKGPLIGAEPNALLLALTEKQSDQKSVTSILKLIGQWRLDGKNRIVFETETANGKKDVLTFRGAWTVGDKNELIYTYEQTDLKTKRKILRDLVFNGHWDISEKNRLTYWLGADSASAFRFRGAFQTKTILAKKGVIRYQAGLEVKGRRSVREIALFGKWKVSRDWGLSFEIEYPRGRKHAIIFGSEYTFGKGERLAVSLKSRAGEPLGFELIFTKEIQW